MTNPKSLKEKNKVGSGSPSIFKELGEGALLLFMGSINTKAGLFILLCLLGFVCLLSPMATGEAKPIVFYVFGILLLSGAAYFLITRIIEIRNYHKKK